MATQPTPQPVENDTNEAVYVKDGLMTWEVFQQALLLISLPLISALLAFLLVLLVKPQLADPARLVPHYQYAYQKNVGQCKKLWDQQNLEEFQNCIHQLEVKIIEFAEHYEEIQNSEQANLKNLNSNELPKIDFLDTELFAELKQKLDTALDNGSIPISTTVIASQAINTDKSTVPLNKQNESTITVGRENANAESTNIYIMTDVDKILKWCAVLKSRTVVGPSQVEAPQCYQRVLQLEPSNYTARRSIRSIKVKYTQWAMRALVSAENGKSSLERALSRAKTNIDRVKIIDPDDAVLADLIRRYEDLEAQYKAQMLDECYDIVDLAVTSEDVSDSDRNFIKLNCPQVVIDEVNALMRSNAASIFNEEE
ncbi:hypothetical protein [Candidatus Albibeggiatoa sp. nov. BB20]|uniref:hypothetical protein n=1 Tax=Candidatus Albibeggiatoa sp. nov. BB20 TaxID=3162723 RepID=UPI003365AF91